MTTVLQNDESIMFDKSEIEKMIKEADVDNDGKINYEELLEVMNICETH